MHLDSVAKAKRHRRLASKDRKQLEPLTVYRSWTVCAKDACCPYASDRLNRVLPLINCYRNVIIITFFQFSTVNQHRPSFAPYDRTLPAVKSTIWHTYYCTRSTDSEYDWIPAGVNASCSCVIQPSYVYVYQYVLRSGQPSWPKIQDPVYNTTRKSSIEILSLE